MDEHLGIHAFHIFLGWPLLTLIDQYSETLQLVIVHLPGDSVLIHNKYLFPREEELPLALHVPLIRLEHHGREHDLYLLIWRLININGAHNLIILVDLKIIVK